MKFPIYIHQTDRGSFSGFFPDIPGCIFAGEDIDATIEDAQVGSSPFLRVRNYQKKSNGLTHYSGYSDPRLTGVSIRGVI